MTIRAGVLASRIRDEDKHVITAFEARGTAVTVINDDDLILDMDMPPLPYDVILERSISTSRGLYSLRMLEAAGNIVINRFHTANTCADKLLTTVALQEAHVSQPKIRVAFTPESAIKAMEEMGYPVIL